MRFELLMAGKLKAAALPEPFLSLAEQGGRQARRRRHEGADEPLADGARLLGRVPAPSRAASRPRPTRARGVGRGASTTSTRTRTRTATLLVEKARLPEPLATTYKVNTYPTHAAADARREVDAVLDWMKGKGYLKSDVTYEDLVAREHDRAESVRDRGDTRVRQQLGVTYEGSDRAVRGPRRLHARRSPTASRSRSSARAAAASRRCCCSPRDCSRPRRARSRVGGEPVDGPRRETALILQDFGLLPWKTVAGTTPRSASRSAGAGRAERASARRERARARRARASSRARTPASCRAACGSASRSPARSRSTPTCCSWTSRSRRSTRSRARTCRTLLLELWRARGHTQVLVTHSIEEAVFLGRRDRRADAAARAGRRDRREPGDGRAGLPRDRGVLRALRRAAPPARRGGRAAARGRRGGAREARWRARCSATWRALAVLLAGWAAARRWRSARPRCRRRSSALADVRRSCCAELLAADAASSAWRVLAAMALGTVLAVPLGLAARPLAAGRRGRSRRSSS